ncbi:hypothetical protein [Bremerella cremea]|uniref:hypothetical protein n=1 Tax=Bremerella cremea TaxID=1031537 RepID=UPI0031E75BD9
MTEPSRDPNPFQSPQSEGEIAAVDGRRSYAIFYLSVVLTIAVITLLLFLVPGVAVLVALVLVPANIRFFLRLGRDAEYSGQWPTIGHQLGLVILSVLMTVPVVIAAGIAFYAVCFGGALIATATLPKSDDYGIGTALIGGVPLGLAAGITMIVVCYRYTMKVIPDRPRRRVDKEEDVE